MTRNKPGTSRPLWGDGTVWLARSAPSVAANGTAFATGSLTRCTLGVAVEWTTGVWLTFGTLGVTGGLGTVVWVTGGEVTGAEVVVPEADEVDVPPPEPVDPPPDPVDPPPDPVDPPPLPVVVLVTGSVVDAVDVVDVVELEVVEVVVTGSLVTGSLVTVADPVEEPPPSPWWCW